MFNLSGTEVIVILLLALVVLGPEKLPDAMRRFGRTYGELKKMGNSFQDEFKAAMDEPMSEMRDTADMLRRSADFTGAEPSGAEPPTIVPIDAELPFPPSTGDPDIDEHDAEADTATDTAAGTGADTAGEPNGGAPPNDLGEDEARSA